MFYVVTRIEALSRIQTYLKQQKLGEATVLLRACREVWPENGQFGNEGEQWEEELGSLKEIFMASLPRKYLKFLNKFIYASWATVSALWYGFQLPFYHYSILTSCHHFLICVTYYILASTVDLNSSAISTMRESFPLLNEFPVFEN